MGFSPHRSELNGDLSEEWSKHNSWDFFARNQAALTWLLVQNRKKNHMQQAPFHLIFNQNDSLNWQPLANNWSFDSAGNLNHLSSPENKNVPAVYQNKHKNYDLHFEFKKEKGSGCRLYFYSGSAMDDARYLEIGIVPPEEGSGGIVEYPEEQWIQSPDILSQQAFVPQGWNDLRVRVSGDQLTIHLNGWKLYSLKDERVLRLTGQFALAASPEADGLTQWRYLRIREIH